MEIVRQTNSTLYEHSILCSLSLFQLNKLRLKPIPNYLHSVCHTFCLAASVQRYLSTGFGYEISRPMKPTSKKLIWIRFWAQTHAKHNWTLRIERFDSQVPNKRTNEWMKWREENETLCNEKNHANAAVVFLELGSAIHTLAPTHTRRALFRSSMKTISMQSRTDERFMIFSLALKKCNSNFGAIKSVHARLSLSRSQFS